MQSPPLRVLAVAVVIALVCAVMTGALLSAFAGGEGTLDVGQPGASLTVSRWFTRRSLGAGTGSWRLPVGTYRTKAVRLTATDGDGAQWDIMCSREFGALGRFAIEEEETKTIETGPPLEVQVTAAPAGPGTVHLVLVITGRAGEHYQAAMARNGALLPPPRLKIIDEAGTVLSQGAFEYG